MKATLRVLFSFMLCLSVSAQSPPPETTAAASVGVTLPVGTEIAIRTTDRIDSKTADEYREYAASIDDPVIVNGVTVLPAHTKAFFRATDIKRPKLKPASLSLSLVAVIVADKRVSVQTSKLQSTEGPQGKNRAKRDLIGGAVGGAIGAIFGGGVGAGIGAGIGAAGTELVSRIMGKGVVIEPETRFTYKLVEPAVINFPTAPAPVVAAFVPSVGQSIDTVIAALGQPTVIADKGSEKLYIFPNTKVTVKDGLVSAVGEPVLTVSDPAAVIQPVATGVAPPAPPPSPAVIEPELIGAIYFQDETGKLVPLEAVKPLLRKGSALIPWEWEGATSPVRIKGGQKTQFVVKLASGVDPNAFVPIRLETKKDTRRLPSFSRQVEAKPLRINVTQFGQSSFALTLVGDLTDGEYAFVRKGMTDSFCFGVGPATSDPK